ncbi:MAG: thioredoxin [Candidatus Omnitrophota bacterium]
MATVQEFNKENFDREVIDSKDPVLVDFWASWCAPCKLLEPTVKEIAGEFEGKMKTGKVNVDDNPEIATKLSILNIPTLILFKGGREASRMIGVNSKDAIASKIRGALGE